MNSSSHLFTNEGEELLHAQAHIWNHIFAYHYSMALKCALELGIPDIIQKQGRPLSLGELAHYLTINPSKIDSFSRLMRLLCHSNFFSKAQLENHEPVFDLTINSKLLLTNHPLSIAPFAGLIFDPTMISPAFHFSCSFKNGLESPFEISHGRSIWDHARLVGSFREGLHKGMASDSRFVSSLIESKDEFKRIFEGIESLVDVGGGDGTMAKTIAKANPGVKCIVLDLPQVVEGLTNDDDQEMLVYVGGNMFEAIPAANVVLLKWILHDWSDEQCVTILQRCKEAIPKKKDGGKVIIIETVVENRNDNVNYLTSQYFLDMEMLSATSDGKERNEQEWKQLFIQAGFSDYKIFSILGPRSVIEVYHL